LWTIFTKWPAPFGPQCRKPRSPPRDAPSRPGVRGAESDAGASVAKIGSSRCTTSLSPPIIRQ
jgi:hypothetical protein